MFFCFSDHIWPAPLLAHRLMASFLIKLFCAQTPCESSLLGQFCCSCLVFWATTQRGTPCRRPVRDPPLCCVSLLCCVVLCCVVVWCGVVCRCGVFKFFVCVQNLGAPDSPPPTPHPPPDRPPPDRPKFRAFFSFSHPIFILFLSLQVSSRGISGNHAFLTVNRKWFSRTHQLFGASNLPWPASFSPLSSEHPPSSAASLLPFLLLAYHCFAGNCLI